MRAVNIVAAALFLGLTSGASAATNEEVLTSLRSAATVRLIVTQNYFYRPRPPSQFQPEPIPQFELPIGKLATELLHAAGVRVVGPTAERFDATLTITAEGLARGRMYHGIASGYLYVGAELRGEITFEVPGLPAWSRSFRARRSPPLYVELNLGGYQSPRNAPFAQIIEQPGSFLPRLMEIMGDIHGPAPLIAVLEQGNGALRRTAADRLGGLGDSVAGKALVAALEDTDRVVRRQAAWALGKIGDSRAVPALVSKNMDLDLDVRWFARWALQQITHQNFGKDQDSWRRWWSEHGVDSAWGNPEELLAY